MIIDVGAENDAPIANNDIYNTEEDVDMLITGLKQALRYFTDGVTRPQ